VEIDRHRVSAASIVPRDGGLLVAAHATEPLPDGAVSPALNASNIRDPRAVAQAVRRVFEKMDVRPKRVALAVPDAVAKVSLLRFDKVPARGQDFTELLKWQVRKAAPFRIDDAQLSYEHGVQAAEGASEFVVVLARKDIVLEYERACAAAGAEAGVVDLTTFNVINAVLAGQPPAPNEDWLLVHVTSDDATLAILRGEHLVFFRNRAADGESRLADMVHQTSMYYEDRLSGKGFGRVVVAGSDPELSAALDQRIGARVEHIDPRRAAGFAQRIAANHDLLDTLAPLVGLIARERRGRAA
jgi:type IV pilus assembly protein PilM